MAGKDIIIMSERELKRLHIIHKIVANTLKQIEAADILGLSDRQIRRMVKRVREEGDKGIIHRRRGQPSNRAIAQEIKKEAIKLYREKYEGFGPTLANEKLFEIDKIEVGDQTLRNWLIEDGDWQVIQKRRKHRQWRERKHHFGEMIQIDGSHHDWFEGRGAQCVLMGYIDDAKNNVYARFYEYEGTIPALDSFKRYIKKYGLPNSIYIDKHSTYKSTAKRTIEDELNNTDSMSQFERAVKELGVGYIHAHSAAAKGRIERLFRTFQDRLIKEMRLRGIATIPEANKFLEYYLPTHNKKFGVEAIEKGDFHRPLPTGIALDNILCKRTDRGLRNDFTIAHDKKLYQIMNHTNAKRVTVEERINGSMFITYRGKRLKYKMITQRPVKEAKAEHLYRPKKVYTPSFDHPWKRFFLPVNPNKVISPNTISANI